MSSKPDRGNQTVLHHGYSQTAENCHGCTQSLVGPKNNKDR